MGLHADRTAERDAAARMVDKLRDQLEQAEARLDETQGALDATPEDEDAADDGGVAAGGDAGAHNAAVQVEDHT